jgi:hypothetical protein
MSEIECGHACNTALKMATLINASSDDVHSKQGTFVPSALKQN